MGDGAAEDGAVGGEAVGGEAPDARLEVADGVATITLDRPDKLNAFTGSMGRLLGKAYAECDADDAVRAVVVTGAGDRAFCAGADLSPEVFRSAGGEAQGGGERAFSSSPVRPPAWEVRKPVIAAINGHAIGIGLTLAVQCDLRVVAAEAKLAFAHVQRGVLPDAHSHWTVPRAIGFARTLDLFLTGRQFRGTEAGEWGLATEVVPDAEAVRARAQEIARGIATHTAPLSVAASKALLWRSPTPDADEADRLETELHRVLMAHPDAREGPVAWMQKRDPEWSGSVSDEWPDGLLD